MDALFPYRKGKTEEIKTNGIHMDAIREVIFIEQALAYVCCSAKTGNGKVLPEDL